MSRILVVGGTGPTGVPLVNKFLQAGCDVTIMHSGAHPAEFSGPVERIIGNARDADDIHTKLADERWDIAICMYGRLRALAAELAGKTTRLVAITGQPVYKGAMPPTPEGRIALPVPEHAPRQYDAKNYTGRVAAGEDQLFEQHGKGDFEVVILRYPGVFGPRAPQNHEWAVVKRILDARPFMILPHDGITYFQRGYVDNLAHLVYLAATRPEASGEAFNAGDERVLSSRYVAELIVDELSAQLELIGVPAQFCSGVFPLAEKSNQILDMSKARNLLGYRDVVDVEQATRITARHLRDNPPAEGDLYPAGTGRFDYAREDLIVANWRRATASMTIE
ncbi:MAG: NAD-dependent epimerase/dehydratase family protein [Gammaproteobacteria bacterium]|nr:NAD-dependent epimerase/dehydratase family protein [Gammaproteobacteria bacterium]